MAHLEDVPTGELIKEVQRRIDCATKPEKHVVLIGNSLILWIFCIMTSVSFTKRRDISMRCLSLKFDMRRTTGLR